MTLRVGWIAALLLGAVVGCAEATSGGGGSTDAASGGDGERVEDAGPPVDCSQSTMECFDQGCVGLWRKQCVVDGDVCVPEHPEGGLEPDKCFKGECYCDKGCYYDGQDCVPDTGCPAVPTPAVPENPSPYEGCDKCPNPDWTPDKGVRLSWSESAVEYSAYDTEILRNPFLRNRCTGEDKVLTLRAVNASYDVYFGTESEPPLVAEGLPIARDEAPGHVEVSHLSIDRFDKLSQKAKYQLDVPMAHGTTYYWKIVLNAADGRTAESPVWSFTSVGPAADTTCPDLPTVTDADGNTYDTVQIGSQCWMKDSLQVGTVCDGPASCQQDNGKVEKHCKTIADGCRGFYTWNELTHYGPSGSICPAGWRLPTLSDWDTLAGHTDFGLFGATGSGYLEFSSEIGGVGSTAYYWSADEKAPGLDGTAWAFLIPHSSQGAPESKSFNKGLRLIARCLKN